MYPSNMYAELRTERRSKLKQKFVRVVVTASASYLSGVMTVLWLVTHLLSK